MKAIGKVLNRKQRKAIKEETMEINKDDLNALFNKPVYTKRIGGVVKLPKKFKEIKIGSVTLCACAKNRDCNYLLRSITSNSYCVLFGRHMESTHKMFRLSECKEAFGKQMILTGRG